MVRRDRGLSWRRLWAGIAWRELWMGMALSESVALLAVYYWYTYLR
jgi:hypothetical protein